MKLNLAYEDISFAKFLAQTTKHPLPAHHKS
jgi:hypothetical protein